MSDHPRSLESTRHCISDRKPKGTLIYIVVAIVAVITGTLSARHESVTTPTPQIAKLLR